jgi:CrcB protein
MIRLLLVCAGGALGSGARYLVAVLAARLLGSDFPFGTLLVNLVGSFLVGFVQHIALSSALFPLDLRVFLTVGILGGFTTYSAFGYETLRMLHDGVWGQALVYVGVTTVFALILCGIGALVARSLVGV